MRISGVPELNALEKLSIITKMGSRFIDVWKNLVYRYAPMLNAHPLINDVAFTNHDFSHHCKDIYMHIDKVLLNMDTIAISEEEYFILAVSVLMHDISMVKEHFNRLSHSVESANFIQDEVDLSVQEWKDVPIQHIEIIKTIVKAHSDVKEKNELGQESIKEHTLETASMIEAGELGENIHVKWLAGILRLADELDVTYARLGTAEKRYENLDKSDADESKSMECWEQLNYFSAVKRDMGSIILELNTPYLERHINDDRDNIVNRIIKIRHNIEEKLEEVNKCAFNADHQYYSFIKLQEIVIEDRNKIFQEGELNEDLGKGTINNSQFEKKEEVGIVIQECKDKKDGKPENRQSEQSQDHSQESDDVVIGPLQLRTSLGETITKFIYQNKLIHYGHYRLNRRLCGQDWIDVRSILADPFLGKECIDVVVTDLKLFLDKYKIENIIAVGINMNGNIMASRVAFRLGYPFTYVIPANPGSTGTEMEKNININEATPIVLFTGVISSMDTIKSVINEYFKNIPIIRIYTVLWRELKNQYIINFEEITNKLFYLNSDFPCEIVSADKCMFAKYEDCIAQNKQAYDEVYEWPLAIRDERAKRIFINNIIGCDASCEYCYLKNIGIHRRFTYTFEEICSEFERLPYRDPKNDIISIGCYSECMLEDNLDCMTQIINYFAKKGYYIQLSTKKKISLKWLDEIDKLLKFENQLNIYVSIPTILYSSKMELKADPVEERITNFEYCSDDHKIKMYLYIKPFLDGITEQDIDNYIELVQKYRMDVIVGERFHTNLHKGQSIKVGKNNMYEMDSTAIMAFVERISQIGEVYKHSTDPIRKCML